MNAVRTIKTPKPNTSADAPDFVGPAQLLIRKLLNGSGTGGGLKDHHFDDAAYEFIWSYSYDKVHYITELAHRAHLLLHRLARRIEAGELLPVGFPSFKDINDATSSYDCPVETGPFREVLDVMHSRLRNLTAGQLRFLGTVMHHWKDRIKFGYPWWHSDLDN